MRKGQMHLLERSKKLQLNKEQIEMLSREDLSLNTLFKILRVFESINDFPADKAYEYIEHGGRSYDLLTGEKTHMSYEEYLSLPDDIRNNPDGVHKIRYIRLHLQDIQESFCETAKWCNEEIDNYESDLYYLPYVISDKRFKSRRINYYDEAWKLDKNTLVYYINFYSSLMALFIEQNKSSLSMLLLSKAKQRLEDDYGTEYELKKRQENYDRIICQNLTTKEYIDYLKEKCHGRIYVREFINKGISANEAAKTVIENISKEEKTFGHNPSRFYDLFRDCETLEITEYHDEQDRKTAEYMRDKTLLEGNLNIESTKIEVLIPLELNEGKPVFIELWHAKHLLITTEYNGERVLKKDYKNTCKFIVYENGTIYINKWGKYQQATVRDIVSSFWKYHGMEILDKILKIPVIKESYVYKDLVEDCTKTIINQSSFPSILWNTCIGYKNCNQLMHTLYKNAENIDFNRMGISNGYAYMKTRPYVDENSKDILYNAFTQRIISGYTCNNARKQNAVAQDVAINYLRKKLEVLHPERTDVSVEVRDYVINTLNEKGKINLRWRSLTKLIQQNIDISLANQNKKTEKIIIPKNSVFNEFSELLPPEFERITTRERIILEGQLMRHCVATYAGRVNRDLCAIYHLEYAGRGYTLEVVLDKAKYNVVQIQSKADRGAPKEVWDFINKLISNIRIPIKITVKKRNSA